MGRKDLSEQRRAQIIEAFYHCVTRYGLKDSSLRLVAKEAGVQLSILHHYFENRDEMIEELAWSIVEKAIENIEQQIMKYKDPETRYNKSFEFLFGPDMINAELELLFHNLRAESALNETVREVFIHLYDRWREGVIEYLVDAYAKTILTPTEKKEITWAIIAIQDGACLQWDAYHDNVFLKKMAHLTRELFELYVKDREAKAVSKSSRRVNAAKAGSKA